jgi:hypothetical protein
MQDTDVVFKESFDRFLAGLKRAPKTKKNKVKDGATAPKNGENPAGSSGAGGGSGTGSGAKDSIFERVPSGMSTFRSGRSG